MDANSKPNVLCFILDQLRHDHLGCAGNKQVQTPHIDDIARKGVMFRRAYVANPLCMPARATLFTGQPPRVHGVRTNGIPLSYEVPTLPEALRRAGYRTHSVGKLHLRTFQMQENLPEAVKTPELFPESSDTWYSGALNKLPSPYYGLQSADFINGHTSYVYGEYDTWLRKEHPNAKIMLTQNAPLSKPTGAPQCFKMSIPEAWHYNRWIADKAIDFLNAQADSGDPFFLWCSFPDPHHPYAAPQPWCDMYNPDEMELPRARREGEFGDLPHFYNDIREVGGTFAGGQSGPAKTCDAHLREMIALTYGMISFVDQEIGRIMACLRAQDKEKDTVIVFLSDHGDMMGDHWMVRKGPFSHDGQMKMPFIWSWPGHLCEQAVTDSLVGQIDFVPTLLDLCGVAMDDGGLLPTPEAEQQLPHLPGRSLVPLLTGRAEKVNDCVIIENDEDYLGLRIRTFVGERYKMTVYAGKSYGELYDLETDPDELFNLWDDEKYAAVKQAVKASFLDAYITQDSALPRRICHV